MKERSFKKNDTGMGKLYLTGAFTLAGTSVVAARYVSGQLGVFTIAAVSMAFALLLLVPLCFRKLIETLKQFTFRQAVALMLQAFFGMFLFRVLLLNGVSRTSALEAGILTGATPAITAFLAWTFLREKVGLRTLGGILATILGGLLVQGLARKGTELNGGHLIGNFLVIGAAASESVFNIICRSSAIKKAAEGNPLDPLVQTTLVTLFALLFCLIPAAFEQPLTMLSAIGVLEWAALLWYGVFVTALAYLCWYAGIKRSGAFTAAAFSGLMPLTSMFLSTVLLREQTDVFQWLGGACVIAGMLLIGVKKEKETVL
jgi:drug/metabolite transporter (DMT)-like permease